MSEENTAVMEPPTTGSEAPAPLRMSYEEYKNWTHEGGLTEWVDGEVVIHMAPKDEHQKIVEFLDRLLGMFVELLGLGLLRIAPFTMRVLAGGNAREPDLFFLAAAHLDRMTSTELNGPADIAIEVISDDSVVRDRDEKFYEYQQGGVREYWIIDPRPNRHRADFYVLDAKGIYQPVPLGEDGIYHSTVLPNFWLKVDWLWTSDITTFAALAEIIGADQLLAALKS